MPFAFLPNTHGARSIGWYGLVALLVKLGGMGIY